ncbi:hypothetical protein DUNSADRAFT_7334 [Dunaliella salina]|uniref:Glycosyl hydrolase family 32 N-terminal domain-containing protein n=1 Tax=Dunaliella salina TaxID=3046 RepID=A0ABQ7FTK0_DUNSA|nr:hypothetical protein DUNSADRAFT_7334 [Dunaliella salina]|eukprot:KAF5825722.1 hypothetical protein DUNSADRAFT_7334 [Dunaliella salina]
MTYNPCPMDDLRFPHDKPTCQKRLLKGALATVTGLLVVLLPVLGVLHGVQEQHDHDRAAAAYEHMKARVPEGFPIHLPEGAGEPIRTAPKPPEAKVPMLPILHPLINYSSLLKPSFHLTPEYGWMNDPNGMFQAPNGMTHAFFQLNPVAPVWGSPW